jgi:hypothetical protein
MDNTFGPAEKATAGIMNALRVVSQAAEKWPPVTASAPGSSPRSSRTT